MTPDELARYHPRLYHLTAPDAISGMLRHGLLPTSSLLDLFGIAGESRAAIEERPRGTEVRIEHPVHGRAIISDNSPLTLAALERCLDDGLAPSDWLRMLNERVFFWADEAGLRRLLDARVNRDRPRDVLVLDTLSLARGLFAAMEVAPINTGATIRRAARRGLSTFAPLGSHTYPDWRKLRGRRDRVLEVTIRGGIPTIEDHLVDVIRVGGGSASWLTKRQGCRSHEGQVADRGHTRSREAPLDARGGGTGREPRQEPAAPSDGACSMAATANNVPRQVGAPV